MEAVQLPFKAFAHGQNISAAKQEAKIQTAVADYNSRVQIRQGEIALRRRTEEAKLLRRRVEKIRASNIAKGSPLLFLEENAINAEIDQLNTLRQGIEEKNQFINQAKVSQLKGKFARSAAKRKIVSESVGLFGDTVSAGASLLSGSTGSLGGSFGSFS